MGDAGCMTSTLLKILKWINPVEQLTVSMQSLDDTHTGPVEISPFVGKVPTVYFLFQALVVDNQFNPQIPFINKENISSIVFGNTRRLGISIVQTTVKSAQDFFGLLNDAGPARTIV